MTATERPGPAAEAPAPEAESPAPEAETRLPEAESPAPEAETRLPETDTSLPETDPRLPEAAPSSGVTPAPEATSPPQATPAPETAASPGATSAPTAAAFTGARRDRPVPSIERALAGPAGRGEVSWRRQVRVVPGGQGPGKRDQEALDRDRARLPLAGQRRIAVLGCTRGAGQTLTVLMTGHVLAAVRGAAIAAVDLNPGATSLAARRTPAVSLLTVLSEWQPDEQASVSGARLDVVADLPAVGGSPLNAADYQRLADLLAARYPLTMIDPAPASLNRVLPTADQLVLVAPASPDAATSLANTQQWLGAHGHGELADRAVTVINGVSRRTMEDVLRAESVARGRCRAIVRVPWDHLLSARPGPPPVSHPQMALNPQTRLAYTALAGVLVAALAADPGSAAGGRKPSEHSD